MPPVTRSERRADPLLWRQLSGRASAPSCSPHALVARAAALSIISVSPCRACLRLSRLQVRHSRSAATPRCSCAEYSPTRLAGGRAIRASRVFSCPYPMTVDCARAGVRGVSCVSASRAAAVEFCLKCLRRRKSASRWWDRLHSFQTYDGRAPFRRPRARGGWTLAAECLPIYVQLAHARGYAGRPIDARALKPDAIISDPGCGDGRSRSNRAAPGAPAPRGGVTPR